MRFRGKGYVVNYHENTIGTKFSKAFQFKGHAEHFADTLYKPVFTVDSIEETYIEHEININDDPLLF